MRHPHPAKPPRENGENGARGLFLVLEGIDGSGKTTQARRLAAWLRKLGREVVETKEPTGGEWGRRYREWARGEAEATPEEVLRFFVEDRREHVARVIGPRLADRAIVVCDRYVGSTLAYQTAHGADRSSVWRALEVSRLPEPDLVLWLRLDVRESLARLGDSALERFEDPRLLERVDAEYARLGYEAIDASGTEEQVERRIRERVTPVLQR